MVVREGASKPLAYSIHLSKQHLPSQHQPRISLCVAAAPLTYAPSSTRMDRRRSHLQLRCSEAPLSAAIYTSPCFHRRQTNASFDLHTTHMQNILRNHKVSLKARQEALKMREHPESEPERLDSPLFEPDHTAPLPALLELQTVETSLEEHIEPSSTRAQLLDEQPAPPVSEAPPQKRKCTCSRIRLEATLTLNSGGGL